MADDVHRGAFVTPAAEWLLDNFHLVASEIRDVRQNLPRGYYRELPKLALRELAGDARVYAMAVELIRHSDSRLDRPAARALHEQLPDGGAAHHRRAVGLAEHAEAGPHREPAAAGRGDAARPRGAAGRRRLRGAHRRRRAGRAAAAARGASTPPSSSSSCSASASTARGWPRCAPRSTSTSRPSRRPRRTRSAASTSGQAAAQVSVANVITSLRLCSTLDWSQYFEAVSLVERVLQRDPAGAYGEHGLPEPRPLPPGGGGARRAHRRGAAARRPARGGERAPGRGERRRPAIAPPTSAITSSARAAATSRPTSPTGPRLRRRAAALRLRPRHRRLPRLDRASLTALLVGARRRLRPRAAAPRLDAGGRRRCSCCCRPATLAIAVRPAPGRAPGAAAPAPPPRLRGGDPRERAHDGGRADAAHQRGRGRGADRAPRGAGPRQPRPAHPLRDPRRLRRRARARHAGGRGDPRRRPDGHRGPERALRRRADATASSSSTARASGTRGEGVWMGWERKRGKIEEFNRLLRGATDTSFAVQVGDAGDPAQRPLLHHPRLRHPPAARRRQEADRHHRPPLEPPALRPRAGPRHRGLRHPAAARQRDHGQRRRVALRAPLRRPHRRRPLHHRGLGHLPGPLRRGHLHRQGALRRGRLHGRARGARARERAPVPRPLRGRLRAHRARHRRRGGGRLSRRASSPTRGASTAGCAATGRSCAGCSPSCPARSGLAAQPPAAHLALEDLRQPAAQPGAPGHRRCCSSRPGRSCPAARRVWTAAVLAALAFPVYPLLLRTARRARRATQPWRVFLRVAWEDLQTALAQVALQLTFLANQACEMAHAIGLTLVRLASTQRRLLEWETAAASAARAAWPPRRRAAVPGRDDREPGHRARSALVLVAAAASGRARRPRCPSSLLWAAAPLVAYALSQPVPAASVELDDEDRRVPAERRAQDLALLRDLRGRGGPRPAPGQLPGGRPSRASPTAPRRPTSAWACWPRSPPTTSASSRPTSSRATDRRRRSTTIEGLERYEGHLLNWYDTQTLAPLLPALRLHRRQRQPRRRPDRARRRAARAPGAATEPRRGRARARLRRRHELPVPLRPAAPHLLHRLSAGRRRRPGPPRSFLLRPAGLRGAAGQLHRHRQGRRAETHWFHLGRLVTSVRRHADAPLVERHAVRVPDAAAGHASYPETLLDQTCRMAVRRQIEYGDGARRALGHLGVGLQRRRPPRQLPVQGLRRARASA